MPVPAAIVACDVTVFAESQIPNGVAGRYRAFHELVNSATVPEVYLLHPHPVKSTRAFYLSPAKAKRAVALLTGMLETIAYRKDWDEAQLIAEEVSGEEARSVIEDRGTPAGTRISLPVRGSEAEPPRFIEAGTHRRVKWRGQPLIRVDPADANGLHEWVRVYAYR